MKKVYSKPFDITSLGRNAKWKKDIADEQERLSILQKPFTIKVDKCPICRKKDNTLFCIVFNYSYKECSSCKHIYSELVLPQENLDKYYSSIDNVKSAQSEVYYDKDIFFKRVKQIADPKVDFAIENTIINQSIDSWYDIGAGTGEIIYSAKSKGFNCKGFEIDQEAVSFAKGLGLEIQKVTLDDNFDYTIFKPARMISMLNVLEHIEDPMQFTLKITSEAKIGSYILVELPRTPSFSNYINKIFPSYSNRHIYPPDHLHIFSDKSIDNILSTCGYEIETLWYFGQDFSDLLTVLAGEGKLKGDEKFQLFLNLSNEVQKVFDKNEMSDTFLMIAKKVK